MNKPKVCIIFTGGTISMTVDEEVGAAIPTLSGEQILSMVSNIDKIADIEVNNFGEIPGPHMTIEKLLELKNLIQTKLEDESITGVIVTHGTDTLEETAYFLDLTIKHSKPVVVVGAMRNSSELGYDGSSNLAAAVCTAVSPKARNKGVLVVLNNMVNAAAEVTKTNTLALDTFQSPYGPLGTIDTNDFIVYREIAYRQHIETNQVERRVDLIKTVMDMDDRLIRCSVDSGAIGIVIEAMGRGNVSPKVMEGIRYAMSKGVIVVVVSRCYSGRVYVSYGYAGGGKELSDMGVIMGGDMRGPKARLKLMLALGKTQDREKIRALFEDHNYTL
ncbi:MAG: asparaginase [Cellulosilyticum sp.]|nr:asparaginase [Cellulosilyticum sp.]MEE1073385.1 asparaginase [Cellulosilyticum sp.]